MSIVMMLISLFFKRSTKILFPSLSSPTLLPTKALAYDRAITEEVREALLLSIELRELR